MSPGSPEDFIALRNSRLMFVPNQRRSCVYVHIVDDDVVEQSESFRVSLESTADLHPVITLVQTEGDITIINDDSEIL